MRWEYNSPEKKLFVSDGRKIYSYIPMDKQVIVGTMPQGDQAPTPALFLTGRGDITRDFNVAFDKVPETPAGSVAAEMCQPWSVRPSSVVTAIEVTSSSDNP